MTRLLLSLFVCLMVVLSPLVQIACLKEGFGLEVKSWWIISIQVLYTWFYMFLLLINAVLKEGSK